MKDTIEIEKKIERLQSQNRATEDIINDPYSDKEQKESAKSWAAVLQNKIQALKWVLS